jgi:hypothetical protein
MVRKKASTKRKPNRVNSRATNRRKSSKKHPVHKRVMMHPFFMFILLCVGVLLVMWTLRADATEIKVTARVAGLPPSTAAEITYPFVNDRFSNMPLDITGTCSVLSYVTISSNDVYLGSTLCSLSGDFSISTTLLPGQNELIPHIYNLADEEGSTGTPVTAFYDVPSQSSTPGEPKSPAANPKGAEPFLISTDFSVRGFLVGDEAEWSVSLSGGNSPYGVNVDWGDGKNSVYSRNKDGDFDISHIYTKPGDDQSMFVIKISGSDSEDNKSYLQFFVIVTENDPLFATSAKGTGGVGNLFQDEEQGGLIGYFMDNKLLAMAWPSYGVITLMATSFWLGEKQGFMKIRPRRLR